METLFNVQRRLFDYQFSLTTTPGEFEGPPKPLVETYNTTASSRLLKDQFVPPIPLHVLTSQRGFEMM